MNRGELRTAQALAEDRLQLAAQTNEAGVLLQAHFAVGITHLFRGEFVRARAALEQSVALYQPQHQALTSLYAGFNPQVGSLSDTARTLWYLGYPELALTRSHEALQLARELAHPFSLAQALYIAAWLHPERGEGPIAQECAEAAVALGSEQGFPYYAAWGTIHRGQALIVREQWAEEIAQVRQGLKTYAEEMWRTVFLAWLAVGYGGAGQIDEGLAAIAEALRLVEKNDECIYEAELYRIKGELLLAQEGSRLQAEGLREKTEEAEKCFHKAIAIAQKQQAKSLELRATMSLARLWQSQGKTAEAQQMLVDIYGWFTEGFDTKDLQAAQALLAELA